MEEIKVKKISVSPNMYVLCVPDENNHYNFYVCHNKYPAVLKLFDTLSVIDPDDDTIQYLAVEGWRNAKDKYLNLQAFIDDMRE